MKPFLQKNWFLVSLASVLLIGLSFSSQLRFFADWSVIRQMVVATVLFLMALPLQPGKMWQTVRRPAAPLLATSVNFFLLPCLAIPMSMLLDPQLGPGLMVAAATPCTMASAAVWTRKAGGNDAVALLVTLITNASCFLVTPTWVWLTTESETRLSLTSIISKLALVVVLPMVLAQLLRLKPAIGTWAVRRKLRLSMLAQIGILTMVFMGAVKTGLGLAASEEGNLGLLALGTLLLAVAILHTSMFFAGFFVAKFLGIAREDQIAVGFSGSQKTLMIGIHVGIESGFSILPMVTYHVFQLVIDTFIADGLKREPDSKRGGSP